MVGDEYGMRTELVGLGRGHGGVDAVDPGFIGAGGDDTPAARRASDDNGFSPEGGIIPLLHRGVEGVHVHMNDLPHMFHTIPVLSVLQYLPAAGGVGRQGGRKIPGPADAERPTNTGGRQMLRDRLMQGGSPGWGDFTHPGSFTPSG